MTLVIRRMAWGGAAAFIGIVALGVATIEGWVKPQRLVHFALSETRVAHEDAPHRSTQVQGGDLVHGSR